MIEVIFKRGLYLPEFDFWLDPKEAKPNAFVSHAHADHFARHEKALCTPLTAQLLKARFNMAEARIEMAGFGEIIDRETYRLRMLPAGHIAGSAMLHVTRKKDGATLLYTGDFKVRRGRTTEAVNFMQADTLIMETTFGLPSLVLPSAMEVDATVLRFVHDALSDGDTPVLFGYSLGKAQEALALLHENGIPVLSHPKIAEMTEVCRAAGLDLPEPQLFEGYAKDGYAILAPPNVAGSKTLRGLKNKRTAMLTGWAMQPRSAYRYKVDSIIPFSDHADHAGLHECVTRVRPKRVLTVHGYSKEFATELRGKGIEAWCASGGDQLELGLDKARFSSLASTGSRHSRPICQFADFSDVCRLIAETNSRSAKLEFLSNYLKSLESPDLEIAVSWFVGRIHPDLSFFLKSIDSNKRINRSLELLGGVQIDRIKQLLRHQSDLARAARLILQESNISPKPFFLSDIRDFLRNYMNDFSSVASVSVLSNRLIELHPSESEVLIRLLLGNLRLGLVEGDVECVIGSLFNSNVRFIRKANSLKRNLGVVAFMAKEGRLSEVKLTPMVPILPMRAMTCDQESISSQAYWLEPNYPGIRAQLHKLGSDLVLFAEASKSLNYDFPDIVSSARLISRDAVLDGVIITRKGGKVMDSSESRDFQEDLNFDSELSTEISFVAFDILWSDGEELLDWPLADRRRKMEQVLQGSGCECSERFFVNQGDELRSVAKSYASKSNAGLLLKDSNSTYIPGDQSSSWTIYRV